MLQQLLNPANCTTIESAFYFLLPPKFSLDIHFQLYAVVGDVAAAAKVFTVARELDSVVLSVYFGFK